MFKLAASPSFRQGGSLYSGVALLQEPRGVSSEAWVLKMNRHIGEIIIRIGFWGPLYYNNNREPPLEPFHGHLRGMRLHV